MGYVVQLLLVALYMSTYDDGLSPDQHAVSAHLTTHHSRNGNIISNHRKPARRQPTTTTQRALVATARQAHLHSAPDSIPDSPPAKKTNPDANDAAAILSRACPRPVRCVVQLLLVALYMSTYDVGLSPNWHAVSSYNLPNMQEAITATHILHVTSNKGTYHDAAPVSPPAKIIKPVGKDAETKFDRFMPSINFSHCCAFMTGHRSRVIMVTPSDA